MSEVNLTSKEEETVEGMDRFAFVQSLRVGFPAPWGVV
jgi:hypothetical protein